MNDSLVSWSRRRVFSCSISDAPRLRLRDAGARVTLPFVHKPRRKTMKRYRQTIQGPVSAVNSHIGEKKTGIPAPSSTMRRAPEGQSGP